ncbi:MAG: hypothetical protein IJT11_08350 [Bacteroidaceae bacterium]|nr:hypothetical protein [Bacteroidaceae bacterium]
MKKLLVLFFVLCPMIAMAQDVIVKKDGSTIVCRVEKVGQTDVTYKLWSDLKGSSYVMDKSLVSAINYENGTKTSFDGAEAVAAESTKPMTDDELLKMVSSSNVKKMLTPEQAKEVKRLRRVGWIVGGTCVGVGMAVLIGGAVKFNNDISKSTPTTASAMMGVGGFFVIGGVATTTYCLIKAHKINQQQSPYSVNVSPLYRREFRMTNGASLATGVDFLGDNTQRRPTLGLGLSYNF